MRLTTFWLLGGVAVISAQPDQCVGSETLAWMRSGDHKKLESIMMAQRTDKARGHRFQKMYYSVLQRIVWRKCRGLSNANRTLRILEIGLGCDMRYAAGGINAGGSVALWKAIIGAPLILDLHMMEYDEMCTRKWSTRRPAESDGVGIHIGDQNSTADLDRVYQEAGNKPFDVIIDDGSHLSSHQFTTIMHMIGRVAKGGAYVIEDMHSSCVNYPVNWRRRGAGKHVTKDMQTLSRIGGTPDCLLTTSGTPSMYAHLSKWQKDLLMSRLPFPELAPSVKNIGIWPEAAVLVA